MKTTQQKTLDIRPGDSGDTAEQTLAKCSGGWLVELAAYPATVDRVNEWMRQATQKSLEMITADRKEESAAWEKVASTLRIVIEVCQPHCEVRARAAEKANAQTPRGVSQ